MCQPHQAMTATGTFAGRVGSDRALARAPCLDFLETAPRVGLLTLAKALVWRACLVRRVRAALRKDPFGAALVRDSPRCLCPEAAENRSHQRLYHLDMSTLQVVWFAVCEYTAAARNASTMAFRGGRMIHVPVSRERARAQNPAVFLLQWECIEPLPRVRRSPSWTNAFTWLESS